MKRKAPALLALVCGLAGLGAWAETSQPLPTPFPESRYQQMTARSPFAVATASADANAAPTPGFAAQLYVTGVAHVGTTDYVAIKTRNPEEGKPAVVFLEVGGTTQDGMKIEHVTWSDEMGKSTVDVSKGGEKATLAFDEESIKNAGTGADQLAAGVRVPVMPGQVRPMGYPGNAAYQQQQAQFNRIRMGLPQPQANGMPPQPNGPAPGIDVRRRLRIIPAPQ